jgi:hypothetical protein
VKKEQFVGYAARTKFVAGASLATIIQETVFSTVKIPAEEILAYYLARHFKSLGPNSKLARSEASAQALTEIASHYNSTGRHEEADSYAHSASAAARKDSCMQSFAMAQAIETISGMQINAFANPDTRMLSIYRNALVIAEYNWGLSHPIIMGLHDRMSTAFLKAQRPEEALGYHQKSVELALKSLGKHHVITAGYLLKVF